MLSQIKAVDFVISMRQTFASLVFDPLNIFKSIFAFRYNKYKPAEGYQIVYKFLY